MLSPLGLISGATAWTLAEYVLHRFSGHGPRAQKSSGSKFALFGGEFGREHLKHHAHSLYFAATHKKLATAAAIVPTLGAAASLVAGPRFGFSFALGFTAMYGGYEVTHRRIHTHAPRGPYSRFVRRHHFYHHFKTPKLNHGVTTPIWDVVFGTYAPVTERLSVPTRQVQPWMTTADGTLRPEFADDYVIAQAKQRRSKPVATTAEPAAA